MKKKIKKVTQQSNTKFERQLPTPLSKIENYLMAAQVLGSPSPCNYTLETHTQYPQDHWHCPFIINKELSGKKPNPNQPKNSSINPISPCQAVQKSRSRWFPWSCNLWHPGNSRARLSIEATSQHSAKFFKKPYDHIVSDAFSSLYINFT